MTIKTETSFARGVRAGLAREVMANANTLLTVFYALVALVAVAGQTIGATEYLNWEWQVAILPAVLLELGGVALAAFSDARRRLGERAIAARVGAVAVAAFATGFNWVSHSDRIAAALFAGFTAFGFTLWLIASEARRRDALRAAGMLPEPPPSYPLTQWLTRPWVTAHARTLAKADPALGVYGSLDAAAKDLDRQRRNKRLASLLERRIRKERGRAQAALAVRVYDMDRIAEQLRATADYEGLAKLLAAEFTPTVLAATAPPVKAAAKAEGSQAAPPAASRNRRPTKSAKQTRRPAEETLALVEQIRAESPDIKATDLAKRVELSPRRLREVLAAASAA